MIPQEIIHKLCTSDLLFLAQQYRALAEYLTQRAALALEAERLSRAARLRNAERRIDAAGRNARIRAALEAGETPQALAAAYRLTDRQIRRIGSQRRLGGLERTLP